MAKKNQLRRNRGGSRKLTVTVVLIWKSSETNTSPSLRSMLELRVSSGTGSDTLITEWEVSSKRDVFRKLATSSLNKYVLLASKRDPGILTRSSCELRLLRIFVIAMKSLPELGDIRDHLIMSGRPPLPKDWVPERERFPQEERTLGPKKWKSRQIKKEKNF